MANYLLKLWFSNINLHTGHLAGILGCKAILDISNWLMENWRGSYILSVQATATTALPKACVGNK